METQEIHLLLDISSPQDFFQISSKTVSWWQPILLNVCVFYWEFFLHKLLQVGTKFFKFFFYHRLLPRPWREDTATMTEKLRNSQPIKLTIIAPSTRLQKECTSWQKPVHRGLTTPYFPTHHTARAAESAEKSALANNCPTPPPNRTNRKHTSNCIGYKSQWD